MHVQVLVSLSKLLLSIWGYNVLKSPLKDAVVKAFESMNAGPGAVRATLHATVK